MNRCLNRFDELRDAMGMQGWQKDGKVRIPLLTRPIDNYTQRSGASGSQIIEIDALSASAVIEETIRLLARYRK